MLPFPPVMSGELRRGSEQESGRVRAHVSEGWRRELERACKRLHVTRMGHQPQVVKAHTGVMRVFVIVCLLLLRIKDWCQID